MATLSGRKEPMTVHGALLDRESLEAWLPPDGVRGRVERWDPRPGGGCRMVLTYLDPVDSPGRTSLHLDHPGRGGDLPGPVVAARTTSRRPFPSRWSANSAVQAWTSASRAVARRCLTRTTGLMRSQAARCASHHRHYHSCAGSPHLLKVRPEELIILFSLVCASTPTGIRPQLTDNQPVSKGVKTMED